MAEQKRPRGRPKGSKDSSPRDTTASIQNLVKARENSPIMQGQTLETPEEYNALWSLANLRFYLAYQVHAAYSSL